MKKFFTFAQVDQKRPYNHGVEYTIPLRFLLDNRKDMPLLYLYCRLRKESIDFAGYIKESVLKSLNSRDRYVLLPQLRQKGWIDGDKLVSVKRILERTNPDDDSNFVCVKINYSYLESKKIFAAYIFSVLEAYINKGKYKAEKFGVKTVDRDTKTVQRQRILRAKHSGNGVEVTKFGKKALLNGKIKDNCYVESAISHSILESWGYHTRKVSRLRAFGINQYKKRHIKEMEYEKNSYYSKKFNCFIIKQPTLVKTQLDRTFFTKKSKLYKNNCTFNKYMQDNNSLYLHKDINTLYTAEGNISGNNIRGNCLRST